MKFNFVNNAALAICLAAVLGFTACDDDSDDNKNGGSTVTPTINNQDMWIGASCECTGDNCETMGIANPSGSPISGCMNMPEWEGAQRVCLRTIEVKEVAPRTKFPQGYCALGAINCTGTNLCQFANYGDYDKMTSCPSGSAMLVSEFDYELYGEPAHIKNKTCAKLCETDADCNKDGEISCLSRNGVKFCYNDFTFTDTGEPTVTAF